MHHAAMGSRAGFGLAEEYTPFISRCRARFQGAHTADIQKQMRAVPYPRKHHDKAASESDTLTPSTSLDFSKDWI